MRRAITYAFAAAILSVATPALGQPPAGGGDRQQGGTPGEGGMTSGCHAMMHAMMHGGGGMPMAGMPMMGMGGPDPSDPRMLQMRGEIMKAVGEIMMKYGKRMEGGAK